MDNDDKKRPLPLDSGSPNKKRHKPVIIIDSDEEDTLNYLFTDPALIPQEVTIFRDEPIIISKINNLADLIQLGKSYDPTKNYNINLKVVSDLVRPLEDLNNMIGMKQVKMDIVEHILFYIQNLDDKNTDFLHTVIQGPPGCGKTELGKILAKIYLGMGILKNDIFKKVSRADMVAKYLGQTAIKTQDLIESCQGGVMFIDEVYSLGNRYMSDSFSKEAIDTLNIKLTELKNDFICIVAGYPKEVEECFFSYNSGLKSRFHIKFSIDPYSPKELFSIFNKIVIEAGWALAPDINFTFFKKHYSRFKYYGRDMENLFTKCKRTHSRRLFTNQNIMKKLINLEDLENGFKIFELNT